tara:strand:- start:1897 stop:2481 length:585 start_codon:yes stop_codon:yes gene_type:complete
MGMIARAGDLLYTFRFLTLLVQPFDKSNAFKLGIIDRNGDRQKEVEITTSEQKSAYTHFHRLVFNLKRLLGKVPGGKSTVASYAAALYLIKEKLDLTDKSINKIVEKSGYDPLDFLAEENDWFMLKNNQLSSGIYKIKYHKVLNSTIEEIVKPKDRIRVLEDCYPVGQILGLNIYEVTHIKSNQKIYISGGEII